MPDLLTRLAAFDAALRARPLTLHCRRCGRSQYAGPPEIVAAIGCGWPSCCGTVMRCSPKPMPRKLSRRGCSTAGGVRRARGKGVTKREFIDEHKHIFSGFVLDVGFSRDNGAEVSIKVPPDPDEDRPASRGHLRPVDEGAEAREQRRGQEGRGGEDVIEAIGCPFTQDEAQAAYDEWYCNCGPLSLAFALRLKPEAVRGAITGI